MYRLTRFGSLNLEHYNQVDDVGSGETPTAFLALADGGALDAYGGLRKHPRTVTRVKRLRLQATTRQGVSDDFMRLIALRGTRAQLFRRMADASEHWTWARLVEVVAQRSYEQTRFRYIQDVELRFVTSEATWRGETSGARWYLNSGKYLNNGLFFNSNSYDLAEGDNEITVTLGASDDPGRAPVKAINIMVTAGSEDITSLSITRQNGEVITYSGTIASGETLMIDTGTLQVIGESEEADAYGLCGFTPAEDDGAWLTLQPGSNQLTFTIEGGGSGTTLDLGFDEAWY